ncbi:MAG: hypothetical protein IT227_14365 [Flavobacteriales bacterium]|nr:hypothetical protein [Flavobacteriales bacterium]
MDNTTPAHKIGIPSVVGSATLDLTYFSFFPDRMNIMRKLEPRKLLHIAGSEPNAGSPHGLSMHLSDGAGHTWIVPAHLLRTWGIFLN